LAVDPSLDALRLRCVAIQAQDKTTARPPKNQKRESHADDWTGGPSLSTGLRWREQSIQPPGQRMRRLPPTIPTSRSFSAPASAHVHAGPCAPGPTMRPILFPRRKKPKSSNRNCQVQRSEARLLERLQVRTPVQGDHTAPARGITNSPPIPKESFFDPISAIRSLVGVKNEREQWRSQT